MTWDEEHSLFETDSSVGPEGYSFFEVALETSTPIGAVDDGKSLFSCEQLDPAHPDSSVTYAVVVYTDWTRSTVSDCVVFGDAPDELMDNDVRGASGQFAAYAYPTWLNRTNCRAVP